MSRLEREIATAIRRHPAGSDDLARPGMGVRRIEIRAAQVLQVTDAGGEPTGQTVTVPPVHALECLACGALLAIGSPLVTKHHLQHRAEHDRPGKRIPREVRKMIALSRAYVRDLRTPAPTASATETEE